jgi:hypothetical protein
VHHEYRMTTTCWRLARSHFRNSMTLPAIVLTKPVHTMIVAPRGTTWSEELLNRLINRAINSTPPPPAGRSEWERRVMIPCRSGSHRARYGRYKRNAGWHNIQWRACSEFSARINGIGWSVTHINPT